MSKRNLLWLMGLVAMTAFAAPRTTKQVSGVLNLNEATMEQLKSLPGMSTKAAQAVLDFRKQQPFERTEDLLKVKGFGNKRFEKLKAHLSVAGESTLKVEKVAKAPKKKTGKTGKGRKGKKSRKHVHGVGQGQGRRHRTHFPRLTSRRHHRGTRSHSPRVGLGGSVHVTL